MPTVSEPGLPARCRVTVVGGGAAGFFAAIACAEAGGGPVLLLERGSAVLTKVRISGGGRCNVTHSCFEPRLLAERYPRGSREMLGPFNRFQPRDTVEWFEARGVRLKTEGDGRMFPVTDRSETVIECLEAAARKATVKVFTRAGLAAARRESERFVLTLEDKRELSCERLILATGGSRSGAGGPAVAKEFGHALRPPVPSLFTFTTTDERLRDLAGVSVPAARVRIVAAGLDETGPVLVTHWGLSGPAILRASAWGARELAERGYDFPVRIGWVGAMTREVALERLRAMKAGNAKRLAAGDPAFELPARLWERLTHAAGFGPETRWSNVTREQLVALADQVTASEFHVTGKSLNKDEFVTCGGVALREVDFRTMQSRLVPHLFFAGELLDLDGITGGFNFQAAWTTGWIAGRCAADAAV